MRDEEQEKKLRREFSRQYHLITRDDRLDQIAEALIKHGRPALTPTAVVRRATLPDQQVVRAP